MNVRRTALLAVVSTLGCAGADFGEPEGDLEPIGTTSEAISAGLINRGEYLFQGNKILSANCGFRMVMQTDGNLVIYNKANTALWASNTRNSGSYAVLQGDSNFVVYSGVGGALWASNTRNMGADRLVMQNDGNAVIYDILNRPIWTSNTRTSGSSTCGTTAQFTESTILESHTDRPGSNLAGMPIRGRDLASCGNACGTNMSCRSFTWVAANQVEAQSQCWLKSGTPTGVFTNLNMTSGVKQRVQQGGIPAP